MNDRKKIILFELGSLIFCLFFSFFNHFLYENSGKFPLFRPFVPINESVFEHGKLLFMPFIFYAAFEAFFLKRNSSFLLAKSLPLALCTPAMITIFYTYSGIIGYHNIIVDIMIAIIIVVLMHVASCKILLKQPNINPLPYTFVAVITFVAFIVFSYFPPPLPLFTSV